MFFPFLVFLGFFLLRLSPFLPSLSFVASLMIRCLSYPCRHRGEGCASPALSRYRSPLGCFPGSSLQLVSHSGTLSFSSIELSCNMAEHLLDVSSHTCMACGARLHDLVCVCECCLWIPIQVIPCKHIWVHFVKVSHVTDPTL